MIEINNLIKEYLLPNKNNIIALNEINLSIDSKGFIAVVGKSGSGKTTLLNILGGLDTPTSGIVKVDGEELNYKNSKQLDLFRCYKVSFIFQDFNLLDDYSVYENIRLGLNIQGITKEAADARIKAALNDVGLEGFENRKISTLSGGQKQRVAIARALCKDSEVVLCDEPTGNLDSKTSNEIFNIIKSLSKVRLFIVVTHDEDSALKFADRVIKISDGKIVEDKLIKKNNINEENTNQKSVYRNKKTYGLGAQHSLQMIKHNISRSAFSSMAMFLLLAVSFTLVSVFTSLSQYDKKDSFVNTLKANGQYILAVTKYVDKVVTYPNGEISYGYTVACEKVLESDLTILKNDMPDMVGVYPSYCFAKPFSDFKNIELNLYNDTGYGFAFKEAVAVDDFSKFNSPLLFGTYPQKNNEILIYDYMADSLIQQGVFNDKINSLAGATLTDSVTGLEICISGIIKSQYENYINASEYSTGYDFAGAYLSGLKVIFCYPSFIDLLSNNREYNSIIHSCVVNLNAETDEEIKLGATKIRNIDINGLNFFATLPNYEDKSGIILSTVELAKILNISENELTYDKAINFLENYQVEFKQIINDVSIYPMGTGIEINDIIAISYDNIDIDGVLNFYSAENELIFSDNSGVFKQIYIGLCTDWKVNKSVVSYFWYPEEKPAQFYIDNPEFYDEIYSDYDPIGFLIKEADLYLTRVRDFSNMISFIVLGMSFLVVLIYTIITLQKYKYKIGVLKALGAKTLNIVLIFGLQLLIISFISFIVSVPMSYAVLNFINSTFVKSINESLLFFSLTFGSVAIAFAFATLGIIIVAGIPLLKLTFTSPMNTIKAGRKQL